MSSKDKLVERPLSKPKDYTFDEMISLLSYYGFELKQGAGSGVKSLFSYEGSSVEELEADFQSVIDDYLEECKERGVEPEQSYKG